MTEKTLYITIILLIVALVALTLTTFMNTAMCVNTTAGLLDEIDKGVWK